MTMARSAPRASKHIAHYDRRFLRLLELSPFERRVRGGGWRFGTRTISDEIAARLIASGRARIRGGRLFAHHRGQPMPKVTATFSDGCALSRQTVKSYTHAWRVSWGAPIGVPLTSKSEGAVNGFAASAELADLALRGAVTRIANAGHYRITNCEIVAVVNHRGAADVRPLRHGRDRRHSADHGNRA
jgi:hypothetical protein